MKYLLIILFFAYSFSYAQKQDTTKVYKQRVLENIEVDFLLSYYDQDGENASITGGVGNEDLQDVATHITVAIPLNNDDVFTIDATVSAYTSASSSNINPFSGASSGRYDDDDDDRNSFDGGRNTATTGSPWVASSGASKSDVWVSGVFGYSHSSDDRNKIWSANLSVSNEFDYFSTGLGGSYTWLFNQKNTEFGIRGNVYLDTWRPVYPTEIKSFLEEGGNLNRGFFEGINILDQNGTVTNDPNIFSDPYNSWKPFNNTLIKNKGRNSYNASFSLSQILNKKAQFSLFFDLVQQQGWLSNPSQRVYFGDVSNYYIGNVNSIDNYTSPTNTDVFQLADDIERLPDSRFKIPVGMRFNYYINEYVVLKTYYRYYSDNWGVNSHTAEVELPIKIGGKFTLYPSYRYYTQTKADYFAPYEENLSTQDYYTSDYDLSAFNSNQYSFGLRYTDIFTKKHIGKLNLKQIDLKYSHYSRNTSFQSDIITLGFKSIIK